ncbi:MAG: SRPBCC domain-containing protein [Oscillospiraceae bacterium]|nr:SRPBCC domain-containing protein [Oscillospiraceae bacterium]
MLKEIKTQIVINASPNKVWSALTDFKRYPEWNPFILHVEGDVKEGSRIKIRVKPAESKIMTFKPTVLKMEPKKELRWLGSLVFKGLFDGEHSFELIDNDNGTTTFIHAERFSGIFVGRFNTSNTKIGFELMNDRLKELIETRA